VLLYSRPGDDDISNRFPAVAEAVETLPGGDLILDGDLVAFDNTNRPDFHLLRRRRPAAMDTAPATPQADARTFLGRHYLSGYCAFCKRRVTGR
jgi:ATP-dependent DNA ligase